MKNNINASFREIKCSDDKKTSNSSPSSRSILVFKQFDDEEAKHFVERLIELESKDPDQDIKVFINAPGGYITSLLCMIDAMNLVKPEIKTYCIGEAASAASILLMCGTKGKRYITKYSRVLLHQVSSGAYGHIADVKISVEETTRINALLMEIILGRTKIERNELKKLIERDCWLTAKDALKYGLVDKIL